MHIGVLTGGGDCPGLNAAIRGVVRQAARQGWTVLGFRDGWAGVLDREAEPLTIDGHGPNPRRGRHHARLVAHEPAARSGVVREGPRGV